MAAVVEVTGGRVRGVPGTGRGGGGVHAFLGVPYAAPAVGPARFAVPGPVEPWDGVRDAAAHGPSALQAPYPAPLDRYLPSSVAEGAEYLNVNVWTPDPGASGLPVVVWIHGGAFVHGANSLPTYDGSAFAADGVVCVGINYRLGVAGYAVLPDAPPNLGLRDQLAALAWVQDNVARFGGDPGDVTVFGESAGAMSVATLLACPAARGLFARAVVQSGTGMSVADADDAARVSAAVAAEAGVEATAAALGALDPARLLRAQVAVGRALAVQPDPARWGATVVRGGLGAMSHFPTVDGDLVPGLPVDVVRSGPPPVPVLVGTTAEEFRLFTVPGGIASGLSAELLGPALARYGLPPAAADVFAARRPGARPGDLLTAVLTELSFRGPSTDLAEALHAAGGEVRVYEFAWGTDLDGLGACHALELGFVFDTLRPGEHGLAGVEAPQRLADEVHGAWVAFARGGDPGWRPYTPDDRAVMVFDEPASAVVVDPRADERAAVRPTCTPG